MCGFSAVLLAALTLVVHLGDTDALDAAASQAFAPLRSPATIMVFLAITSAGTDGALVGMVLVATALLAVLGRRPQLRPLWLTFFGTELSTYGLKFLLGRARPAVLPGVGHALSPSFPSAHSAGTAAVIGMIGIIIAAEQPPGAHRFAILCGAGAVALLIGFSRLLLNLHYLSDVIGGFLVALVWLPIGARMIARRTAYSG